jgi:hypothetical protein
MRISIDIHEASIYEAMIRQVAHSNRKRGVQPQPVNYPHELLVIDKEILG